MKLSESEVGDAALDWLAGFRWSIAHRPNIAADTPGAEPHRLQCGRGERRSRGALERLNPNPQVKLSTTPEPEVRAPHRWRADRSWPSLCRVGHNIAVGAARQ